VSYLGNSPVSGDNTFRILDDISSYTLTFDGSSASVVSVANNTLTFNNHRFITGQKVTYNNGGGAIGNLADGQTYYIIKNDQNTIKLATPIPDDIKTSRQNVRILCNKKVTNIGITTVTSELATYVTSSEYSSWNAPYSSWVLNPLTVQWEAPVAKPELTEAEVLAGSSYRWNEETLEWILETPEVPVP
jgi:hypothetical protein